MITQDKQLILLGSNHLPIKISLTKFFVLPGSAKHRIELASNHSDDGPTVGELTKVAAELTQVPEDAQKLIYKGWW